MDDADKSGVRLLFIYLFFFSLFETLNREILMSPLYSFINIIFINIVLWILLLLFCEYYYMNIVITWILLLLLYGYSDWYFYYSICFLWTRLPSFPENHLNIFGFYSNFVFIWSGCKKKKRVSINILRLVIFFQKKNK